MGAKNGSLSKRVFIDSKKACISKGKITATEKDSWMRKDLMD
jgi:hypothetical protein